MRTTQYLLSTLKEIPSDAEAISHQLMLRAGMIRQLSSGLYSWLPTGIRVLKKVESIVREEMKHSGAIEILMPILQPEELWRKSGRLEKYGQELLGVSDRGNRRFLLGPTHEEVITKLIQNELHSYQQLPLIFFQIQTKFRDEIRPRYGLIRSREFLMKDAYSFHISQASLQKTYDEMCNIYNRIFSRIGLDFCILQANTGEIGGNISHEFQAFSKNGESNIVVCDNSDYIANIDFAQTMLLPSEPKKVTTERMRLVDTSSSETILQLVKQYNLPIEKTVKTLLVKSAEGSNYPLVALLVRGDHEINRAKAQKLPQVASPLTLATEKEIRSILNLSKNWLGPVNLPFPIIADYTVSMMNNFVAGANINGKHYFGINWNRDISMPEIADIRNVIPGDLSPDGKGRLLIKQGIEVGHIFQVGEKYSRIVNAVIRDQNRRLKILKMGCYGIGITRTVAAVIEQNYDEFGIIWPDNIAPFQVAILPINMYKSCHVQKVAEELYNALHRLCIDVILDDRKERPGVMFADTELLGIPHIVVISDQHLKNKEVEYKYRRSGEKEMIKTKEILNYLKNTIDLTQ